MKLSLIGLQLLLSGFFALACLRARARVDSPRGPAASWCAWLPRWQRYRLTRVQWGSFIGMLLLARVQGLLPPAVEAMAAVEFIVFLLLPTARAGVPRHPTGSVHA